jgi:uroporphyrin-III C-methyltransferase
MIPSRLTRPEFAPGSVWIAGAGPGDPGLLTLHAVDALERAEVVLHDALVSPEILALATARRRIAVGKRAGGVRTPQLRINQMLIAEARAGQLVLRLKGGDPLLFGRGSEEAMALVAAGIPFRIIPGVSAGLGGTAAAGIPLTHRGLAQSVAFVTGQDRAGALPPLDALARGADTLVFYMARRQAQAIAAALLAAGRAPGDAAVFIAEATTARQRVHETTLAEAAALAATLPAVPTLLVTGKVTALRPILLGLLRTAPMDLASPSASRSISPGTPRAAALTA